MLKRLGNVFLWLGVVLAVSMILVAVIGYFNGQSFWQFELFTSAIYLILGVFFWFLLTRMSRLFKPKEGFNRTSNLIGQIVFWMGIIFGFGAGILSMYLPLYDDESERVKHLIITFIFWYFMGWLLRYIISGRSKWYPWR